MNEYSNYLVSKSTTIEGLGPWAWLASDQQAWQGITWDWMNSHKAAYLEHVTDWSVCIQAGGCMGLYARLFSDMFERVYTFEPDPLNFLCLTVNCQKDNIVKMQAALGHKNQLVGIRPQNGTNSGMHIIDDRQSLVPMLMLDQLELDACGLIQLDVEFYELNVLRGALKTIEKFKPVITCELGRLSWFDEHDLSGLQHNSDLMQDDNLEADILALLAPYGYKKVGQSCADAIFKVVEV